jgi:uncharacterized protein (TIGR03083 family)
MSEMTAITEVDAFVEVLAATPSDGVTACPSWTAHELVAHLVSGVEAIAEQAEAHLAGDPIPEYGSFAEREQRFWPIADEELRRRLVAGERRMSAALAEELEQDQQRVVAGIGWGMPIRDVVLHIRQEFAVHRWDLVGDDAVGDALLGRSELIDHSVRILAESLLAPGVALDDGAGTPPWSVRIRAGDEPDLVVTGDGPRRTVELLPQHGQPADIRCDAAARLLLLWGRRPADASRVRSSLDVTAMRRVHRTLRGF